MTDIVNKALVVQEGNGASLAEIQARIYLVRGVQVMLDIDLAVLYGVENRSLRQAVRRNIEKFPEDFLLKLKESEANDLISKGVSQNVIPQGYNTGGMQMFAFTEQGVSMLATVLRSKNATEISIAIMRAFVAMRRFLTANAGLFQRVGALEQKQIETEKKLDVVLDKIEELSPAVSTEEFFCWIIGSRVWNAQITHDIRNRQSWILRSITSSVRRLRRYSCRSISMTVI